MNRTLNILNAFGFQGGTVHQVAEITGCDVDTLLYTEGEKWGIDYSEGWFAYRTNSSEFNQRFIQSEMGNIQFWLGVAQGVETTRKQGLPVEKKF